MFKLWRKSGSNGEDSSRITRASRCGRRYMQFGFKSNIQ